jgi:hypothetical protein
MTRRNRVNAKGRSTVPLERFIGIRRSLLHSPQFSALSCTSRSLLFELQAMFNGTNNGAIFLSVRDATARLGLADFKAAQAAFTELRQLGWITETVAGCFAVKAGEISRARAWHLNWIGRDGKCTGSDALPPLDYAVLTKNQRPRVDRRQRVLSQYLKDYQRGQFAVEESTTLSARMAAAEAPSVEESTTSKNENGGKQPIRSVGESTTHIKYHSPVTAEQAAIRRARLRLAILGGSLERISNNQIAAAQTPLAA